MHLKILDEVTRNFHLFQIDLVTNQSHLWAHRRGSGDRHAPKETTLVCVSMGLDADMC